ncbi:hypothetical protein VSDG_01715 [Cytospora chrysosperma]|uniref:N-acetyltransferase domain-containing protein n=1 Tax=Cytospora chrysosperma TaxID=252740 RepID=A0A423WHY5_CYTCH|nr:hypothetical protein VSDG_01715 [Valsa sordida]
METQSPAAASGYAITSPRLTIRTAVHSDGEALVAFFTNPANFPWEAEAALTLEKVLPRIDRWAKATAEGKSAFMVVVLRESNQLIGFGGFNSLPYTEPLGSQPTWTMTNKEGREEGMVLAADIGMSIDHKHQRKGYAREAICASIEGLMKDMGIEEVEGDGGETLEDAPFGFARKSYNYQFDRNAWEGVRDGMKKRGKWPL